MTIERYSLDSIRNQLAKVIEEELGFQVDSERNLLEDGLVDSYTMTLLISFIFEHYGVDLMTVPIDFDDFISTTAIAEKVQGILIKRNAM